MSRHTGPYVVRQDAFVFVAFLLVGVGFVVASWFDTQPLWLHVMCVGFGMLAFGAGVVGWKSARVGLVADRAGIWLAGYSFIRKTLVPWNSIIAVKRHDWSSPEGQHQGVLIGLESIEDHPACKWFEVYGEQIDGQVAKERGDDFGVPLLIGHDEWDWDPDEFVELVSDCLKDPASRDALGEFHEQPKHVRSTDSTTKP